MIVCEPGTYQLQTGQGPLDVDPGCGSSHCELLNQTTLATLEVVHTSFLYNTAAASCFSSQASLCHGRMSNVTARVLKLAASEHDRAAHSAQGAAVASIGLYSPAKGACWRLIGRLFEHVLWLCRVQREGT